MQPPPLLPDETLFRVLRLARFDGLGVLVLGAVFAVLAASARDIPFALIGLLAAGAGAVELHGASLLREGESRGMRWLIASQPFLLLVIWSYCGLRLANFEIPELPEGMAELAAVSAAQWDMSVEQYFRALNRFTIAVLATLALGYQGAMTVYYWRRCGPVSQALQTGA